MIVECRCGYKRTTQPYKETTVIKVDSCHRCTRRKVELGRALVFLYSDGREPMQDTRKLLFEYAITELLEEMEFYGVVERSEVQEIYETIADKNGLIGLLPRVLTTPKLERTTEMSATTPTFESVLIHRKKGVMPAKDYLEKVVSEFNTCHVHVTMDNGKMAVPFQDNKALSATEILENLEIFPEEAALYFGKASAPYSDSDLPPHELIPDKLCCLLDATLLLYDHPESQHSREFFAVNEYLIDELKTMYEKLSDNLDNLHKEIETEVFRKRIANGVLRPRGSIIMIASDGKFHRISVNADAAEFDNKGWWTSRKLDTPAVAAGNPPLPLPDREETAAEKRARILAERRGKVAIEKAVPVTPAPKPETAPVKDATYMIMVPSNYDRKHRLGWIREHLVLRVDPKNGEEILPEGWETAKGFVNTIFKPNSPLLEQNKSLKMLDKAVEHSAKVISQEVVTAVPVNQRQDVWKIILDRLTNDKLLSPEQLKAEEDLNPSWDNQFITKDGKEFDLIKMIFAPGQTYKKVGHTYYQTMICLAVALRNELLRRNGKELVEELQALLQKEADHDLAKKEAKVTQRAM